jgi:hypothetical protein
MERALSRKKSNDQQETRSLPSIVLLRRNTRVSSSVHVLRMIVLGTVLAE